ncbi:MAG: hypothetical protein AVDCRST_MAG68-4534, partial [uncultured Gemmatimonadetes bacterium]
CRAWRIGTPRRTGGAAPPRAGEHGGSGGRAAGLRRSGGRRLLGRGGHGYLGRSDVPRNQARPLIRTDAEEGSPHFSVSGTWNHAHRSR